jgi:phospholipid/cholesterol/gamma-HCH transport system ATP-binding protein
MIEIKNIDKSFAITKILKDISFVFDKGLTNLVIGQSGSGKTVLLKCLLGLYKPDNGSILFNGKDIVNMTNKKIKNSSKRCWYGFSRWSIV